MRTLRFFVISFLFFYSVKGIAQQNVDLGKMDDKQRKEYLEKLAKEVTKTISLDSYNRCDFERETYFEKRNTREGRVFYTVSFFPIDKKGKTYFTFKSMDKDGKWIEHKRRYIAASIDIWENTGQPKLFMFEDNNGIIFDEEGEFSYREWEKRQQEK